MFKIDINGMKNFSSSNKARFKRACKLLEDTINSPMFSARVLEAEFKENRGHAPREILFQILSGADKFNKAADKDLDIYIHSYFSFKNVVGYTYPSTYWTWINRRYLKKSLSYICGNIMHEYMHNMGYTHKKRRHRSKSVPYVLGKIARQTAKEIYNQNPDKYR